MISKATSVYLDISDLSLIETLVVIYMKKNRRNVNPVLITLYGHTNVSNEKVQILMMEILIDL